MGSIGWAELFFIIYLVLPFFLRKRYPLHPWLGFMVGLFNPLGMFYVKNNALEYFIGLVLFGFVVQYLIPQHINALVITALPGGLLNLYRVHRARRAKRSQ